jgi:hypothetical protein
MNQIALDLQPQKPEYRMIPLSQGKFAKVDAADFEWLSQWKWYAHYRPKHDAFYAVRNKPKSDGRRGGMIYMHREIMGAEGKEQVDHKRHLTLDNRRDELRKCNNRQNHQNIGISKSNKSGVKGVSWAATYGQWVAMIRINGVKKNLGLFSSLDAAAEAYAAAARIHHGEFLCLGFQPSSSEVGA